jgi:hypothetical protein
VTVINSTFTDDELATVKLLRTHRNRVHFLLMLGYFKFKPVCLTYQWKDVELDYQYIAQRYYPNANKQKINISRLTQSPATKGSVLKPLVITAVIITHCWLFLRERVYKLNDALCSLTGSPK